MAIVRVTPRIELRIGGATRSLLGGGRTEGPRVAFPTATVVVDPAQGKPNPGETVEIYENGVLGFTGEIDAAGINLAPNETEVQATHILARTRETIGTPPTVVSGEAEQTYLLSWESATATTIIGAILTAYGITRYTLTDSGRTFGNLEPVGLAGGDNGWALIAQLDEVEGYKTFGTADGGVVRQEWSGIPSGGGRAFTQGVDLFAGKLDESRVGTYNQVTATGLPQTGTTGVDFTPADTLQAPSPWIPSPPTYRGFSYSSPLFETADECSAYAARKLGELNRLRGEMPFELATGDETLRGGMAVTVDALRLDVRANVAFRVLEVNHSYDGGYTTRGTLLLASEGTGWSVNQPPVAVVAASAKVETLADGSTIATVALDGSASYDPELGTDGIVSYVWTGSPVAPTPFNAGRRAAAVYAGGIPDGATVTLTVTDDLGKTGATTIHPSGGGVPLKTRDLISAELTRVQTTRDGGATWVTVSPNVAGVGVTEFAAAEYGFAWTAGGDLYKILADDTSVLVLSGAGVTACGITLANGDPEQPTGRVWAAASDGRTWRSNADGDAGTWTERAALPNGAAATYILESPFAEGDVEAAAGNVYYRSFDNGANWTAQVTHPHTTLIAQRVASGFGQGWVGFSGGGGDDLGASRLKERAATVTLDALEAAKPLSIQGLALDPFEETIYVLDVDSGGLGRAFRGDVAVGGNLAAAGTWDTTTWGVPRHMARDGTAAGYLYIAATDYLLKSVDGLATIKQLKALSGGAEGRMIGYGAERVASVGITVVSTGGVDRMRGLWNGTGNDAPPAGWYAAEYDDAAWGLAVQKVGQTGSPLAGTQAVWWDAGEIGDEQALLRRTFAVPAGTVAACTIRVKVDNFITAVYLNGVALAGTSDGGGFPTWTYDGAAVVRPGRANVLAIWAENGPATIDGAQDWVSYEVVVS